MRWPLLALMTTAAARFLRRVRPRGLRVTPPRVLAVALLLVLVTNALLAIDDLDPRVRAAALVAHVALGLLVVPIAFFALYEAYKARRRAFPIGHALVLLTGIAILVVGGERRFALFGALHAFVGAAFATWSLVPRRAAFLGAPFIGLVVGWHVHDELTARTPGEREPALPAGDVEPDRAGGFLDVGAIARDDAPRFVDIGRCQGCHADVVRAHDESPHRHASVTNPFYLQQAKRVLEARGPDAAMLCAGCHDHGLAVFGRVEEGLRAGRDDAQRPAGADVGIPCLSCHGATTVRSVRGNGALALALPDDPVVRADGLALAFARVITRIDPKAHRKAMMPDDGRASLRCGACHEARLHRGINDIAHSRGQTDRDTFLASGFAKGSGASALHDDDDASCVSCHMGKRGGGHLVAAAHTALPAARGARDTVDVVARALQSARPLRAGFLRVTVEDGARAVVPVDGAFDAAPGDDVALDLLIVNAGVGHRFPGGTVDLSLTTVEVAIVDAEGRVVLEDAGPLDDDGVPAGAHPLGVRMVDAAGVDVRDHDTMRLFTPLFDHTIAPGHGHVARYRFRVPRDVSGPLTARAAVSMKKVASAFAASAGVDPAAIPSVVVLTTDDPALTVSPAVRLARYADAMGVIWDDDHAAAALATAQRLAPADLEVKLATARFLLERRHERQRAAALLDGEPDARARFLRARALLDGGEPQEAYALAAPLARELPYDVEALRTAATAARRVGDRDAARTLVEALLAQRPDDFEALRLAAALAGEARDGARARALIEAAERVRVDREATAAAVARAARDPWAAREADRDHAHVLVPAWRERAPGAL